MFPTGGMAETPRHGPPTSLGAGVGLAFRIDRFRHMLAGS